jgi:hypothetical protein
MRRLLGWALVPAMLAAAGSAGAASLEIRNAALRVVVIPEARSDVSVSVLKTHPKLPLRVRTGLSGQAVVDGGRLLPPFGWQPIWCDAGGVHVWGVGRVAYADLPQILVRMPLEAQVSAGGGVFGAVSRSNRLDLEVSGCGAWTVGNVRDHLAVRSSSSATVRTGTAGQMALEASGSGLIVTRAAGDGLDAALSGSGAITVEQASGAIRMRDSGSGEITVNGGQASNVDAGVSGSGDIQFNGAAEDLRADLSGSGQINAGSVSRRLDVDISGSGDMAVRQASGAVTAHISGSGALRVDGGHATSIEAHLSGSGDVNYAGVADRVQASTSGSGDLVVARVTGRVASSSSGSGRVITDR